jgi:hypothetical protein
MFNHGWWLADSWRDYIRAGRGYLLAMFISPLMQTLLFIVAQLLPAQIFPRRCG